MAEEFRAFKFGIEIMPNWFRHLLVDRKVKIKTVYQNGVEVLCCYFTNNKGEQVEIKRGQMISEDMFL